MEDEDVSYEEVRRERDLYQHALEEIVHDGRNYANLVHSYVELLEGELADELGEDSEAQEMLDRITASSGRLEDMFDDASALVRGDQYDQINIYQTLRDCVDRYAENAEQAGLSLRYEGPEGARYVETDIRIDQVFENLIKNTFDHAVDPVDGEGADEAVFQARDEEQDGEVVIVYTDDGPGLGGDARDAIHEPGRKGDNSSGMGLGMTIVTHILEESGAAWDIGDAEGGGFKMEMRFPYSQNAGG